ncbi:hypothetical protein WA026_016979 [Henosepilachna vigintioctopunctata]|uniref:NTF2 domain-containing protein n=1 Tax=Henosepilachna vigintioctopunctata TaxID=420089 RepID=A0AAW1U999_9CUCU
MTNCEILKYSGEIEDILSQLADEEVISLAITITGGLLKNRITSRKGAVKAVLNYSKDVQSILRRKIFTREKLLSYLYEKNVPVNLPITKHEIIGKILKLWNIEYDDCRESIVTNDDCSIEVDFDDSSLDSANHEIKYNANNFSTITSTSGTSNNLQVIASSKNDEISTDSGLQSTVNVLAREFSQWFYKLLNDNHLTSDHFFPDVSLNLTLLSSEQANTNNISNDAEAVTNCLLTTKLQNDLFFNPNISEEGLKAQMDPHGLVMVIVCGTLHSKSVCVGVFEQMFALARDPFAENNWKIKRSDLRLKNSNITTPSILCDTNVSSSNNYISIKD